MSKQHKKFEAEVHRKCVKVYAMLLTIKSVATCRRHKKRKLEEMQYIKGGRKQQAGYSSGGGLTSRAPIFSGLPQHHFSALSSQKGLQSVSGR